MATLAPLATPARRPFGVLNETKLRNLQSIKNKQNAITPNSAPAGLKRRAPSPELSDSENIDPNVLDSLGKRKRAAFDDDVSLSKPSRYNIHVIPAPSKSYSPATTVTPRLDVIQKPAPAPLSAPAAAGRSPTRGKRMGLLKPGNRFTPPSFGGRSSSLSIKAALKGTLAEKRAKKARTTIQESKPKSWFFDIFEEAEETQDYKMNEWTMMQSANILDISDDESKAQEKSDRGKENVDPNEVSVSATRSVTTATTRVSVPKVSRKDAMIDEPRTPLGNLNASEFYGDGLDATSVVLVQDDADAHDSAVLPVPEVATEQELKEFTFETHEKLPQAPCSSIDTSDIGVLLAASTPVWDEQQVKVGAEDIKPLEVVPDESGDIDIWESESAKDENEKPEPNFDEPQAFALQEL